MRVQKGRHVIVVLGVNCSPSAELFPSSLCLCVVVPCLQSFGCFRFSFTLHACPLSGGGNGFPIHLPPPPSFFGLRRSGEKIHFPPPLRKAVDASLRRIPCPTFPGVHHPNMFRICPSLLEIHRPVLIQSEWFSERKGTCR